MSKVSRALGSAVLAGAVSFSLLAEQAALVEGTVPQKVVLAPATVPAEAFRSDTDQYIRELNEQLKQTLSKDLRLELTPKLVLANNELRARG